MLASRCTAAAAPTSRRSVVAKSGRRSLVAVEASMKVAVTGAAGRTGALVVKKLVERGDTVVATVRSAKSADKVAALGVPRDAVRVVDIATAADAALADALAGADALVVCTSGVPEIIKRSLVLALLGKVLGKPEWKPSFRWKGGELPEAVDWLGQKRQFDAALAAGVRRVVVVSSMGGTDPENALNKLGAGNILQWKRKAEQYLIALSEKSGGKLSYTIIHPGGLVNEPGGVRQVELGVDDAFIKRKVRSIPRDDVAALAVACVGLAAAAGRSFDAVALPAGEGAPVADLGALVAALSGDCDYSINDCSAFGSPPAAAKEAVAA